MKSQLELIQKGNWKILIILDACRYDIFKELFPQFSDVDIKAVESPATGTRKWLLKTFPTKNKLTESINYISANPFINSKNVCGKSINSNFNGNKVFYNIQDVWLYGFDKKTGRVEAETTSKEAFQYIELNNRINNIIKHDDRYIIHYQQPHAPYLYNDPFYKSMTTSFLRKSMNGLVSQKTLTKLFLSLIHHSKNNKTITALKEKLVGANTIKNIADKYGNNFIKVGYTNNLMSALPQVVQLIGELIVHNYINNSKDNIIITADHAEYLGENGLYGHGGDKGQAFYKDGSDIITTVPWVVI